MKRSGIVVGIDVGGVKKGFHAVALSDGGYLAHFNTRDAAAAAAWCNDLKARLIGVDAPCRWSTSGGPRAAERALMANGIHCFPTPSLAVAKAHGTNFYGWMLAGAQLYHEIEKTHTLYRGKGIAPSDLLCFESFPHAIVCDLTGCVQPAKEKRVTRPRLLRESGVHLPGRASIDIIDAALCALTAHHLAAGSVVLYGDEVAGFIVTPKRLESP